jgi:hypothetical protein
VLSWDTRTHERSIVSPVGVHALLDTKVSRLSFQMASVIRESIRSVTTSGPGCCGNGGSTNGARTLAPARSNWPLKFQVSAATEPVMRR